MAELIQIRCKYTLGDVVALTAAVRDISRAFPGRFQIAVQSGYPEVWQHNPYIHRRAFAGRVIDCAHARLDREGKSGRHYIQAYLDLLNERLGTAAELSETRGDIHLSEEEQSWYSDIWNLCGREVPFWLICSGGKFDIPIKWWDSQRYQKVVDALRGRVQFVQVGWWGNHHPRLEGAIDLRGKTAVRDLIHLVHHADGVVCGVTALMHLAAAVPARNPNRAAIIVAGNREPKSWEAYPGHIYLSAAELQCANCWNSTYGPEEAAWRGVCARIKNNLPLCMDMITSEEIVHQIERLEREGRARFLSRSQEFFAAKARRRALASARFDQENVTVRNAAGLAARFLASIPQYPAHRFRGRGIVICAGGVGYFARAWVCIRMLRQLGCRLPVEIWHLGRAELDDRMAALVAPFDVTCVDAKRMMSKAPMRNPLGWELKCYSILQTRFREVLSLDADNVPVENPEFLFDTPEYGETGAIFWPDYRSLGPRQRIWRLCDVPYRREPEFESGQMVIDKERCWRALKLAWWYNDHSEFFYRYIHGDKDTFHMAWHRTGTNYVMPPFPIESLDGVMCQHDFQGRRIFQHRNAHKWSFFGENCRIPGFQFEDDCLKHLEELRSLWSGRIGEERECRTEFGAAFRTDTVDKEVFERVVVDNEYRLPGNLEAHHILDVGAHIGSFIRACHERGSREIHAFEPHPGNFELALRNTRQLAGVDLRHGAVLHFTGRVSHGPFTRGIEAQNTGGVAVFASPGPVQSHDINELLREYGYVHLMKLDCEGSEWPILFHLSEWRRLGAICGEYHLGRCGGSYSAEMLVTLLRKHLPWVAVEASSRDDLVGKFWASHVKAFFNYVWTPRSGSSAGRARNDL